MRVIVKFKFSRQRDDVKNALCNDDRIGTVLAYGIIVIKKFGKVVLCGIPITKYLVFTFVLHFAVVGVYLLFWPGMARNISDNHTAVDYRENYIVGIPRIEPAGYSGRKVFIVIEAESALFQIWVAESSFIEVRQSGRDQFIVYIFRLIRFQQVQVQRCRDVCCFGNHQVHASDSRQ